MAPAIVWFRRNLRLDDNLPLDAALRAHDGVVPVFVLDDHYLTEDFSPPRLRFLAESLRELESDLAAKGSRLLFRKGPAGEALASLARETDADAVYSHLDHEPHGAELAREAEAALAAQGTKLRLLPDLHLVLPGSLRTEAGKPFTVYTPYARRWREADKALPVPAPPRVATPPAVLDPRFPSIPMSRPAGFRVEGAPANPQGGEREGRRLWGAFRASALPRYAEARDLPGVDGTSRLSPHLRFGTVGIRSLLAEARSGWKEADEAGRRSIDVFVGELAWREFYASILAAFPRVLTESFRPEFERFPWITGELADARFAAWRDGRTGYPIVDAGMRQLAHEGWMHNRVRMVVASFLTKHLLVDWRRGEALLPGEPRRRRPRLQQRRLAVVRRLRHRRPALLPDLQPRPSGRAVRPGRDVREALGPRDRRVEERGQGPPRAVAGVDSAAGLPRPDRRPRGGAGEGARGLRDDQGRSLTALPSSGRGSTGTPWRTAYAASKKRTLFT